MRTYRTPQRGVALIVALLVVALATILIAALLDRGGLVAARTRNGLRDMQAQDYARGLESYAAKVLWQDAGQSAGAQTDFADDIWAIPLPPTPVPAGEITATMTDLDGRFNLNNLSKDPALQNPNQLQWAQKFGLLLSALKLDPALEQSVENWMDPNVGASADDGWYAGQPVAYRPAKRTFSHVSELRLVKGFDGDTYTRILPYVSALPVNSTININTASVPVLMTLNPNVTEQDANAIWQQGHAHFTAVADVIKASPDVAAVDTNLYGFSSNYFLARGDITLDGLTFTFYSLLERRLGVASGSSAGVHVLQRSRGGD